MKTKTGKLLTAGTARTPSQTVSKLTQVGENSSTDNIIKAWAERIAVVYGVERAQRSWIRFWRGWFKVHLAPVVANSDGETVTYRDGKNMRKLAVLRYIAGVDSARADLIAVRSAAGMLPQKERRRMREAVRHCTACNV